MSEATDRDQHQPDDDEPEEGQPDELDDRELDGDPDLISLVQLANGFGIEQRVVLTLAGQTIAGTLIGARSHFSALATAVQGDDPDETFRGALAARFRKRGEHLAEWGSGSKLGDLDPDTPTADALPSLPSVEYLHLRDATVVTWPPSGQRLPLWRGRIYDVVGWTVGDFEDAPADD